MAITDTLAGIKEYFMNWHHDYYSSIHSKTDNVTNHAPDNIEPVTSEGVYNYVENKATTLTNNLQEYARNTCNNIVANNQPKPWNFNNKITTENKQQIIGPNGFQFSNDFKIPANAQNGLITPKEKVMIYYCTKWFLFTGDEIIGAPGTWLSKHMQMRVNLGLGLVYFRFYYKDCPWLVQQNNHDGGRIWKASEYADGQVFTGAGVWKSVVPGAAMVIPTNLPDINIQIKNNEFNLIAEAPQTQTKSILTSSTWYYQNDDFINAIIGNNNND